MEKMIFNRISAVFVLAMLISAVCLGTEAEAQMSPETLFKVGDYRSLEIMRPQSGFIGGPRYNSFSEPGPPKSEEHYMCYYVRMTVQEIQTFESGTRILFQLDKINPETREIILRKDRQGNVIKDPPALRVHMFVRPDWCIIRHFLFDTWEPDSPQAGSDPVTRAGFPLPTSATIAPALYPQGSLKNKSFIAASRGGIVYHEMEVPGEPNQLTIEATYIDRGPASVEDSNAPESDDIRDDAPEPDSNIRKYPPWPSAESEEEEKKDDAPEPDNNIRYYSDSTKTLSTDSVKVRILAKETQLWDDKKDWLWQRMERVDEHGYVVLRCRQLE